MNKLADSRRSLRLSVSHAQLMRIVGILFLAIGLIAGALAQEFKGVTYKTPPGWQEATEGDTKIFAPKDLKDGELLAIIMTGAVASNGSSWEKQFTDTIALANDKGKASEASEIRKQAGGNVTLLMQTLKLDAAPIGKHSRLYAQVSQGEQRVFVTVLIGNENLLEKHGAAVTEFLANLGFKATAAKVPPVEGSSGKGKIPTGNTPDLFPGTVGWLPSGHGVPIPTAEIVNGKPIGLWWKAQYDPNTFNTRPVLHIFLADGTRASNPRLGGGMLYDIEGQRAQKGNTGLGTFSISGGQMVENYNGFVNKGAFVTGTDADGKFFKVGGARFRPLVPLTTESIAGHWQGPGIDYKFKADGTYESGMTHSNGDWAVANFHSGTYILDGYLIMLKQKDGPSTVSIMGRSKNMLATNSGLFFKK